LIWDDVTGQTMAQAFEEDLGQSLEMRLEAWNHRPLAHRLGDALARCFSPLL
jgi:CubicO group peptidase (beta-lactamase class C family)